MSFSREIKEIALVNSKRRCCVCREFGGRNIEVHHITPEAAGGPNTLENAIVLCQRCHGEAGHYNPKHPIGNKYSPSELLKHRDNWWSSCKSHPDMIDVSYKSVSLAQDIHKYRLLVTFRNISDKAIKDYRIEIFFPVKIPLKTEPFIVSKTTKVKKNIYNKIVIESQQKVFPGQEVEIFNFEKNKIEYEMNDNLYLDDRSGLWTLIWRFYASDVPMIEDEKPWEDLHKF